jgi:hypothetical protein
MSIITDFCDALILELDESIALPDHNTLRYARPRGVLPQICPLLAVWYGGKVPAFVTTGDPMNPSANLMARFMIGWWQEFTDEAKTLVMMEDRYSEMLNIVEQIERHVIGLGVRDLVDTNNVSVPAWQISFAGSEPVSEEGLVEGYYVAVAAMVDQRA